MDQSLRARFAGWVWHEFTRAGRGGQLHNYGALIKNRTSMAATSKEKSEEERLGD
jgi:hypothetical protein